MVFKYPMKDVDALEIKVYDGSNTDVDGNPIVLVDTEIQCTITAKGKLIEVTDGKQVKTIATIFKKGNIFEDIENVTGVVILYGIERRISYFNRIRIPNKTAIHHIEIGVE